MEDIMHTSRTRMAVPFSVWKNRVQHSIYGTNVYTYCIESCLRMTLAFGKYKIFLPSRWSDCYVGCFLLWLETAQVLLSRNTSRGDFAFELGQIRRPLHYLQVQHVLQMRWHKFHSHCALLVAELGECAQ